MNKLNHVVAGFAALILLQTLFFKFSAATESVYIFKQLGMEPYGRIGVGIAELIAGILLIVPVIRIYGAFISIGIMMGAVVAHVTQLGIIVLNDGGSLFLLCCTVILCCSFNLYVDREKIKLLVKKFSKH